MLSAEEKRVAMEVVEIVANAAKEGWAEWEDRRMQKGASSDGSAIQFGIYAFGRALVEGLESVKVDR